jgi:hypothetical protein
MFGLIAWLTITGYALYYLGNDDAITLVMLFHWTIGLAAPIFFLLHRFMRQQ